MSNEDVNANIIRLMTSFHLKIKALSDDLKCAKCKSVLKNACQMPCGCRLCRACIDDVISRGDQFCPGVSQECGATPLSTAVPDYRANKSVLKLTAKCPNAGCSHDCPMADMDGHIRACSSKNIDCPFRELGYMQGALPGEEMSDHLLHESRSHSEILIGTVANISKDMEMMKRELLLKDEQGRHMDNEMKLIKDKIKSIDNENKAVNYVNKSIIEENKSIKNLIKSLKDENKSIKIENESIKIENKSIKREREVLSDRLMQLAKKLERQIDDRRKSDERDSARLKSVTAAVRSNRDEIEPIKDDIRSIWNEIDCMNDQMQSIPAPMGQLDNYDFLQD